MSCFCKHYFLHLRRVARGGPLKNYAILDERVPLLSFTGAIIAGSACWQAVMAEVFCYPITALERHTIGSLVSCKMSLKEEVVSHTR
jgi:hypothetical protein